ncbi:hypothetical protein [Parabacteroides bouchesdurhonensis]|uniref:MuF-C-terminal domain-containing protein n=1 Tax=Parabacteroides bouchesdurhonensis TaxID=1936995 RepID=UPI000C831B43|nr:hypothetical protein [Parabacteroides bouchesdurhonensis]
MEDNAKKLYETLSLNGYEDIGNYKDFEGKLKDSGKREILYGKLKEDGFEDIGSLSDFNAKLGYPDIDMADQGSGKGFWDTYLGDAIEKLNAGGAQLGAGLFGALDKATIGLEKLGLGTRGGVFKEASDYFKDVGETSRINSVRNDGKSYSELWKEGDYTGAIGDIALQGIESLPVSISAAAATIAGAPVAGLAGIGAITASDKYDQLDAENPNMGEFAKASNAIITGTAEGLSEMLGAGVSKAWMKTLYKSLGRDKAEQAVKKGLMGQLQRHYKEFGMFYEPVEEGIEEVASQLAENITDKVTGADPNRDITDGLKDSFVYGMGGGAYFSAAGAPGFAKRQYDKIKTRRDYNNAKEVFYSEFKGDNKMLGIGNELEAATPEEKSAFLEALESSNQFSQEQKDALFNLVQSDIAYKSLRTPEAINEEKNERRELSIQTEMMNYDNANAPYIAENGMIQQVFINGDMEHPVCIVKGDVVTDSNSDGEMIMDSGKSSESMYYLDPNGEMQIISPKQISGVANIVSAVDQRAQYEANLRAQLDLQDQIREQQRKQEEEQEIVNGDDVTYMDPDTGKQAKGKVVDIMPESEYMSIDTGDGTLSTVPKNAVVKSAIQTIPVDRIENGENIDKTSENIGRNEGFSAGGDNNMSQSAQNTDIQQPVFPMKGNEIDYKSISDPNMYADALVSEFGKEAGATIDDIITSKQKELAKASKNGDAIKRRRLEKRLNAELSMLVGVKDIISPKQQIEQIEPKMQPDLSETQPASEPTAIDPAEQGLVIPVNENGDPLYHKADINDTLDELLDGSMTIDEVDQFVDANLSDVEKRLAATDKHAPKVGKDRRKFIADKQAWEVKRVELQQEFGYWSEVKEKLQDARIKPGEEAAINLMRNTAPQNGEELAAQMLANGSLKLSQESYKKELGVGMGEARSMFGLFAGKDKGGVSIERAGEMLMLADLENGTNFFDQNDPNAGRNAIIEVLSSSRTRGDLIDYIKNNRKAKAEQEQQTEYNEYAAWCEENYHLSPEDYEAYEESIVRDFAEKQLTVEERQELDSQIADEIQAIREEQDEIDAILAQNKSNNNEDIEGNDESGGDGLREGGSEILQGEQLDPSGRSGEIEAGEPAGSGIDRADGVAQESAVEKSKLIEGEEFSDDANTSSIQEAILEAEQQVDTNPTNAQKEAGNYKKGHVKIDGFDITIEQPVGSVRSGKDADGKEWSVIMNNTYGYIRGTEGVDGDHIDIFLSDSPASGNIYVVDQVNADGSFDEHKVMYGFNSTEDAKAAYLSNYSPGWKGLGIISEVSKEEFKKWVDSSRRKTKPFSEYKSVEVEGAQNEAVTEENAHLLPGKLKDAYASGNVESIANAEKVLRDYVAKQGDLKLVVRTYFRSMDNARRLSDKDSPEDKMNRFVTQCCKESLKDKGIPAAVLYNQGARRKLAGETTDPHVLDIMSVDPSVEVLSAVIRNPNTGESTLRYFTKAFSNNGLEYEAQQELDRRQSDNKDNLRFREKKDETSSFSEKHDLNENDVRSYADAMRRGNLGHASYAFKNIQRTVRLANDNLSLGQFVKLFSPIKSELYERFGDVDVLRKEHIQQSLDAHNAMEAARKRAEEEIETERKRLEEFELMSDELLDAAYFEAVDANNESRMQDIVNEAARRKGYLSTDEFRMAHRAPSYDEEGIDKSMVDVANNKDLIRDSLNEQFRMNRDTNRDESAEAISNALNAINKGEKPIVTIYRAVPKSLKEGKVRNGDWVSLSESYAKQHGHYALDGNYKIMKEEVPAENLYWDGNDINEWGYDDKSDYRYKNTKNNRKLNDLITRDDKGGIIPPSKRFNSRRTDPRFHFIGEKGAAGIDEVNQKFNEELQRYQHGEMGNNEMFHLGTPQGAMLSFIPKLPIVMRQKAVRKGIEKKHNVDINTLLDMPSKISSPIFVFQRSDNTIGVLTEMKDRDGKNVCVAIEMSKSIQDGGKVLEVNDVRSFHGREIQNIISPIINNGTLRWVDKEKALDWFSSASQPVQQEITNEELSSATKIVESFVNPTVEEGKITSAVDELTDNLNTPVQIIRNVDEITDNDSVQQNKKRGSRGWYDPVTGKVYLVLPNAESVADAQATVLHEVVAHKGLRGLLGDSFSSTMETVFDSLPQETQESLMDEYGDRQIAAEEYCAHMAETMSDPGIIQKICSIIKDAFRSMGVDLKMSDGDIMYMLWKSKNRLKESDTAFDVMKKTKTDNAVRDNIKEYDTLFRSKKPFDELRMSPEKKAELKGNIQSRIELLHEAYVDRMIAVKKLQDIFEKKTGKPIPDYMNVYLYENTLSPRNTYEQEQFKAKLADPMVEAVERLTKKGITQRDIENYVMAKHGLERNEKMRYDELADASDCLKEYPFVANLRIALRIEQAFICLFFIAVGTPIFKARSVPCTSVFVFSATELIFFVVVVSIFFNYF